MTLNRGHKDFLPLTLKWELHTFWSTFNYTETCGHGCIEWVFQISSRSLRATVITLNYAGWFNLASSLLALSQFCWFPPWCPRIFGSRLLLLVWYLITICREVFCFLGFFVFVVISAQSSFKVQTCGGFASFQCVGWNTGSLFCLTNPRDGCLIHTAASIPGASVLIVKELSSCAI